MEEEKPHVEFNGLALLPMFVWRVYGWGFYSPIHRFINYVSYCDIDSKGNWKRRCGWWDPVKKWLHGDGIKNKARASLWRYPLYQLAFPCHACPHCGDDNWLEDDMGGKTNFVCERSGSSGTQDGTQYWWEGWKTCWRCGHRDKYGDST